jgi:hypothetical protein
MTMSANSATTMKSLLNCNPCSRMSTLLTTNQIICFKLSKWVKLVELSMATVLSNVENERCLFNLSFMKSKLRNQLIAHLDLVVQMYAQSFYTMETFPYTTTIKS